MTTISLKAEKRKLLGRKSKSLRKQGILPANIYGKKIKSESVEVSLKEFQKVFDEAGETSVVEIALGAVKKPVLIHNIQVDPVTGNPLHADFYQVDLKQKVTAQVPVEVVGESPTEKQGLGTLVQYVDEVEVEALPNDLPEKFEIDASALTEVNAEVFVKDLKFDSAKVTIKDDIENIVVKIEPPKEEKIEVPEVAEGDVPAETPEGTTALEGEGQESADAKPQEEQK